MLVLGRGVHRLLLAQLLFVCLNVPLQIEQLLSLLFVGVL